MSRHLDDRYVWLGFGIFFVAAAYGIRYAITDIVQLTVLVPFEVPAKTVTESPEDCTSTLSASPLPVD